MKECGLLGQATRTTMNDVMAVYDRAGQSADLGEMERHMAANWHQGAQRVDQLQIVDRRLQGLQADLAAAYATAGDITLQAADFMAGQEFMTPEVERRYNDYQNQAQEPVALAIDALNRYCIGGL
ncbi:MAG: hypothetical protein EA367_14435 [Leptolyngbya sp. DLM2.Bin15]|nr:MAG: hypothetical protein EA367_14435 [Leptolyngbya sp. DLM2.Bin15]